ncbi:MAG: MFS transporter [Gammaproteobacteria bacterium]
MDVRQCHKAIDGHESGKLGVIGADLARVLFLPASLLMLCVAFIFRFADGFWITLAPIVVVQELGYDSTQYSSFISLTRFIAAMAGLGLGQFIDKRGIKLFYGIAMALYGGIALSVGLTEFAWSSPYYLVVVGFLQAFIYQGVFISFIASSMNLCWVKVSATQFAIYMAWANPGRSFGAGSLAALQDTFSYSQMFMIIGLIFLLGVLLVWLTKFRLHRESVKTLGHVDERGDFAPHG